MPIMDIRLSREMDTVLDELAEPRGLDRAGMLRRSVAMLKFLSDAAAENVELIVRDQNTGSEQLVLIAPSLSK